MLTHEIQTRVRYSEVDQMGYVYHGNYAQFYEMARTELIRTLGIPYAKLEEQGIIMPLADMSIKFVRPALYDDVLTIKVMAKNKPTVRIVFEYEIINQHNELINTATTTLIFMNGKTRRPMRPPAFFMEKVEAYFTE